MDFDINAAGTLNVLQNVREHCPDAPVIHCSTNKVYGDRPNSLPFTEHETRWELDPTHPYAAGIDETMSIDTCLHSLFGASKTAADLLVQEYGRYFGLRTACFRGGTLTGPGHSATELHGFLAYVMRCAMERRTYKLIGYKGKQVRDAIHSHDVIAAFEAFFRAPRSGEVYNLGGGRHSNASNLEAIALAEKISGNEMVVEHVDTPRTGDHIWWISSNARFEQHYPDWQLTHDVPMIMQEIHEANADRWTPAR
jgi:CDP-paratose 2-epimerase